MGLRCKRLGYLASPLLTVSDVKQVKDSCSLETVNPARAKHDGQDAAGISKTVALGRRSIAKMSRHASTLNNTGSGPGNCEPAEESLHSHVFCSHSEPAGPLLAACRHHKSCSMNRRLSSPTAGVLVSTQEFLHPCPVPATACQKRLWHAKMAGWWMLSRGTATGTTTPRYCDDSWHTDCSLSDPASCTFFVVDILVSMLGVPQSRVRGTPSNAASHKLGSILQPGRQMDSIASS